ncbi:DUF2059 domain-containing protein [Paraglaciecola hydrolytica]|uniref:DUF2059 domain-containing protein n=1 Tax=Paraglaciecola hydrolytica TaxID=1799789 RepID=A0A148KN39_9ALTE|nr:DUF2059 domain-containing protein [Paraglaciecola hydrolytica]KXI27669.1 hypothetical protein AX660_19130 [Paraglaciecola hydrolytica]
MKKLLAVFLSMGIVFSAVAEQASKESVEKLMVLTGASDMGKQMMGQMLPAMQQMIPDAPPAFWQSVTEEINMDEMVALIVPVYQKHLTEEDIQHMLKFFSTPAGKKLISVQPVIMQESMMIGQQWGQQLFMRAKQKYDAMTPAAN